MVFSNEKKIERKVFTSFFQDGSVEAFVGIILLQLGLPVLFSRSGFGDMQSALFVLPIALVLLIAIFLVRKFVTLPRLGHVKFSPERRRKISKLLIFPIITLIAGVIVGYFFVENTSIRNILIGQIPFILASIIVFSAAAYFLDMNRLYIYGGIVSVVIPLSKYIETIVVSRVVLPVTILSTAFIFFIIATIFFIACLRKYKSIKE